MYGGKQKDDQFGAKSGIIIFNTRKSSYQAYLIKIFMALKLSPH